MEEWTNKMKDLCPAGQESNIGQVTERRSEGMDE